MSQCRYLRVSKHHTEDDTWNCMKEEGYKSHLKCIPQITDRPSICSYYIEAENK